MIAKEYITMSPREINRLKVVEKIKDKKLTQVQGAEQLKLSERQMIRICKKYQREGPEGLVSKRRGKASNNVLLEQYKKEVLGLIKEKYYDFGPTLAHEKITELHNIKISVESVRQLMIKAGIWQEKRRKKARVHQMRTRRSQYGELVQIDGSPHAWFEDRGPRCSLLVFVDDATGRIIQLYFEPEETCEGYMEAIKQSIKQHGRPLAYYSDKHSIFRVNAKEAKSGTGETQLSRALRELDIELINANTPQAKGRVERMNGTLQDRLVKELRLKGISDIESANKFVERFIKSHNKKFAVDPAVSVDAHRRTIPTNKDLNLILCLRYVRTISKNLEVRYKNQVYQIQAKGMGYAMRNAKVQVNDYKGEITLVYKNQILSYRLFDPNNRPTPVVGSKRLNQYLDRKKRYTPAADHPWRRTAILVPCSHPSSEEKGDISTLEKR